MLHANPFALLVSPEQVRHAVAHSERLAHLRRRVYRPLDKPLIPQKQAAEGFTGSGRCV